MSQNIYISPLYRWVLHQQFQQVTRRKTRGKPSNFCCLKSLFLPKRSYCLCSFWSWEVTPVSGVIRSPEWCRHVSNVTLTSWWHDSHYTMMLKTGWQGLNRTTSRAVNIHWICKCLRPLVGFFSSEFFLTSVPWKVGTETPRRGGVVCSRCVQHSLHFKCADMYQSRWSGPHLQRVIGHLSAGMDDPSFERLQWSMDSRVELLFAFHVDLGSMQPSPFR